MTFGQAVQDPTTRLGQQAAQQAADRKARVAAAQKIADETGRELLDVLTEMFAKGL